MQEEGKSANFLFKKYHHKLKGCYFPTLM